MPTRNVHLTEHFDKFISAGVEAGRYSNASEAVRAGLRLLEQREQEEQAKLAWLRGATTEAFAAFDRGEGIALNSADGIGAFMDEIVAETTEIRSIRRG